MQYNTQIMENREKEYGILSDVFETKRPKIK